MIDFRTYNDPGVYISSITPPVVFTAAIEPTILAIIGDAPASRDAFESTNILSGSWTSLTTLGGNPLSLNVKDKLLGTPFVSGVLATLVSAVDTVATSWTVTTIGNAILPATPFVARVEDEYVNVTVATAGTAQSWTITRRVDINGANAGTGSAAASHGAGQVINYQNLYGTLASVEVGVLASPISSADNAVQITPLYGVQVIDTTTAVGYGAGDSFKLTYGGQETIAFVHGTNATASAIQAGLIVLSTIGPNGVTVTGTTNTGPFTVTFLDPNVNVTPLTVTTPVGYTGAFTVTNRGVTNNTFLDVEGERMRVTAVSGSAPQNVTVVRGFSGTTANPHGAVNVYENTGADYAVKISAGDDSTYGTADDVIWLTILDTSRIVDGTSVNVAYQATDAAQFSASIFNDIDTIREKYGDPLDANGEINSALSLAALIAIENGATQLVLIATDSNDTNPVQTAIAKLEFEQSVNSVVILSANANDINYLKGHVSQMENQGILRRAFVGLNGLNNPAPTSSDYISKANQLHDERVTLVAPGQFKLDNGTGTPLIIPGYYGTVAVAGLQAGLGPAEPLTRKQIFGFIGLNDQDTQANIFSMQANGVLVVFEDRLGRLIVKHGLTTDMTSVYTREISVVTSRDRIQDFIKETLESGELVGSPMTAQTPNLVVAAVSSALEEASRQGLIFDYGDVTFRYPTENPTMIQVRFSYKPTLPLNYIQVQFSIDTSVGTVDFQNINDNTST